MVHEFFIISIKNNIFDNYNPKDYLIIYFLVSSNMVVQCFILLPSFNGNRNNKFRGKEYNNALSDVGILLLRFRMCFHSIN
jgi:hypothetical protein